MKMPLNNTLDLANEREGTIQFTIRESNLFDTKLSNIRILEIIKGQTVFILERDHKLNLLFIQSHPTKGTKIAKVNIQDYAAAQKLFVAFSWSEEGNKLYVGDYNNKLRSAESYVEPSIRYNVGTDGKIYQIGDIGLKIGQYQVKVGKDTVLESTAKEVFDFQMEKVLVLISKCKEGYEENKKRDFLFESTLVQQIIVMMTTAFEVYAKTRFLELEKEGITPRIDDLYRSFIPKTYLDEEMNKNRDVAEARGITELRAFIEGKKINFQDWEHFKKAYNKGYGIVVGEIGVPGDLLELIQKFIKWRHGIIHSKIDYTVLNWDEINPTPPIFADKNIAEKGFTIFQTLINTLHEKTMEL